MLWSNIKGVSTRRRSSSQLHTKTDLFLYTSHHPPSALNIDDHDYDEEDDDHGEEDDHDDIKYVKDQLSMWCQFSRCTKQKAGVGCAVA